MDEDFSAEYLENKNTTSHGSSFSSVEDNDKVVDDDVDLWELLWEDIFSPVTEDDNSEGKHDDITLAMAPNSIAKNDVTPQPKEHDSITSISSTENQPVMSRKDNKNNSVDKHSNYNQINNDCLNEEKEIVKRKRSFANDGDQKSADCLNGDGPPVKRMKRFSSNHCKPTQAERERIRRLTIRKLTKTKRAEKSLRKFVLMKKILLRFYKNVKLI